MRLPHQTKIVSIVFVKPQIHIHPFPYNGPQGKLDNLKIDRVNIGDTGKRRGIVENIVCEMSLLVSGLQQGIRTMHETGTDQMYPGGESRLGLEVRGREVPMVIQVSIRSGLLLLISLV